MHKILSSASVSAITAHKALGKAANPKEGTKLLLWWILVAKFNLAATLWAMESFDGHIRQKEVSASDISRQTRHLLEMCTLTGEMWEYLTPVRVRNNSREVSRELMKLTESLLRLMSALGDKVEGVVADEIKIAIERLESYKMAA